MNGDSYTGKGHKGNVYVHKIHGEIVVIIGVNGDRPSNREDIASPRSLTREPDLFIDDLLRKLPESAVIPVHPSLPHIKYAGSPKHGYVVTVDPQYQDQLMELINPDNRQNILSQ